MAVTALACPLTGGVRVGGVDFLGPGTHQGGKEGVCECVPRLHPAHTELPEAAGKATSEGVFLLWRLSCSFGSQSFPETTGTACLSCPAVGSRP